MDKRERLRRERCEITVNDHNHDVVITSEFAEEVSTYLREQGLAVSQPVEAATGVSVCRIHRDSELGAVKNAISEWKSGVAQSENSHDTPNS